MADVPKLSVTTSSGATLIKMFSEPHHHHHKQASSATQQIDIENPPPFVPCLAQPVSEQDELNLSVNESLTRTYSTQKRMSRLYVDVPLREKRIAMLTSGGDAPGMNAAVRAVVAVSLAHGAQVFGIQNGYSGLIKGGKMIRPLGWPDIGNIIHVGGTIIGSARCPEFRERSGRLKAAKNLVLSGINNLICIGGDGSLTGADTLKREWPSLLKELVEAGEVKQEDIDALEHFNIVGMVGSIDNDMCGISMTLGSDTALHRIVDAIDDLLTTAESHQRTFVVEVMGRDCGFLALGAAIACGADWVFIPENPPDCEDWASRMCESVKKRRQDLNYSLVIVCEGSTDRNRVPIKADQVCKILSEKLGHDTRVTTLGHVQRGGAPSAYDRILGCRTGAEAALTIINAKTSFTSVVIGVRWNQVVSVDLQQSVAETVQVGKYLKEKNYSAAMKGRGQQFEEFWSVYADSMRSQRVADIDVRYNIAIMHCGAPAAGMNSCAKVAVRDILRRGHRPFGVIEGFKGLVEGHVSEIQWADVSTWSHKGGAELGTNRTLPSETEDGIERIAQTLHDFNIHGMIVIGGFEAYHGLLQLIRKRKEYRSLRIPMNLVPATISNNVPGTDISLGCDTALNCISESIDRLKQSAAASRRRVFVVETMGGYNGFLAAMGALAGGADTVYTNEERVHVEDMVHDVQHIRRKFNDYNGDVSLSSSMDTSPEPNRLSARQSVLQANIKPQSTLAAGAAIIVRNEFCSANYNCDFMLKLFSEEGNFHGDHYDGFTARSAILGHLQQGGSPSPLDRIRGARLAVNALDTLLGQIADATTEDGMVSTFDSSSACLIAIQDSNVSTCPLESLVSMTDFKNRTYKFGTKEWWQMCIPLVRTLENNHSRRNWIYNVLSIPKHSCI